MKHTNSRTGLLVVVATILVVGLAGMLAVPCFTQGFRSDTACPQIRAETEHSQTFTGGDPVGGGGTPRIMRIADNNK